jgi:FAD/FMN-containing dehydrogenase
MSEIDPGYLEDASGFRGHAERLCVPNSEEEVSEILRLADAAKTPVTIAGAGTGVAGGRVARGGWILSVEKLRDLHIHPGFAVCGAGVTLANLHEAARASGQFYPPDPTETLAFIGGNIACNASGSRSFRYGDTRRRVRRLRVVHANGRIAEYRRGEKIDFEAPALPRPATTKFSAGYRLEPGMDWVDLFVGSEGTLGVITEAELELIPARGELLTGVVFFGDDDVALKAAEAWRGVEALEMLEYLDGNSLALLRPAYPDIPPRAGAALLIEQQAAEDEVERWIDRLEQADADVDGSWFAFNNQDRERFRRFRHALPETVNDIVRRGGFVKVGSDLAVPIARNAEMLAFYRKRLDRDFPGQYVIFGHIGDAHVHVNILPRSGEEFERAKALMLDFAREAVRLGGTVGAEHGLGKRKANLLPIQYTPEQIDALRAVKRRLDPNWILSPGNLFA